MTYGWRICSFSGALGDMPTKDRSDAEAVLAVLRAHPRFTVFDVCKKLAATLDELTRRQRLRHLNVLERYPWCRVEVLPPTKLCTDCNGTGRGMKVRPVRRLREAYAIGPGYSHHMVCEPCQGTGYVVADPTTLAGDAS